ncbi:MobC family plasmid mobilization relaxosome protein [Parabacteroides distasonis]|uniref:MobC family plasmid mobilization relaxosome protein n=1 Tax=Parabacteroides distasonis TaxID=823 RepID=A0A7L5EJF6_PARDI|nr:MobC family plasmid mobilization relaxosome protein [Parabacteroides distasonis]QJE30683.1 MobC family plasmid mobilization relaxosome protein [Parabacteroides distasonis]
MEKKYTITLRLSYDQFAWLCALCRRSKQTQSAVIRSLIESGTVRERITKEHIHIIRQLIGESTNLNQLAKQANTYGFFAVAERCEEMAQRINQLIKQLKDDR